MEIKSPLSVIRIDIPLDLHKAIDTILVIFLITILIKSPRCFHTSNMTSGFSLGVKL